MKSYHKNKNKEKNIIRRKVQAKKDYSLHREEWAIKKKEWVKNNPMVGKRWTSIWREKYPERNKIAILNAYNRRRKRVANTDNNELVTLIQIKILLSNWKNKCAYCGSVYEVLDHVMPLCRGGKHSISNLLPSCSKCNREKYKKTVGEWKNLKLVYTSYKNTFDYISSLVELFDDDRAGEFSNDKYPQESLAVLTGLQGRMSNLKELDGNLCYVGENPTGKVVSLKLVERCLNAN